MLDAVNSKFKTIIYTKYCVFIENGQILIIYKTKNQQASSVTLEGLQ